MTAFAAEDNSCKTENIYFKGQIEQRWKRTPGEKEVVEEFLCTSRLEPSSPFYFSQYHNFASGDYISRHVGVPVSSHYRYK